MGSESVKLKSLLVTFDYGLLKGWEKTSNSNKKIMKIQQKYYEYKYSIQLKRNKYINIYTPWRRDGPWASEGGLTGNWGGCGLWGLVPIPILGGETESVCWNIATLWASCSCFL